MARRITTARLFLAVFLGYALYFLFTMFRPTYYITGDQVYYLTMAASLWDDGDLDLNDEYSDGSYRAYYPQPLSEADLRGHHLTGREGGLYSRHGIGLPLLILPAWGLGRQVGVSLWLIVLTAILSVQLFHLARQLVPDSTSVWLAWTGVILAPPLTLYAPLAFTELPAALALSLALRYGLLATGRGNQGRPTSALALAATLFLPWLNPRYALLVIPLAIGFWLRGKRWLAAASVVGVALPYLHFWFLLGYLPTLGDYGRVALGIVPNGAPGLWLDREAGLLPFAPIYALALYGLVRAGRGRRSAWRGWNWLWLPYLAFLSAYSAWYGGWNPPGRMMAPLLPCLAPLIALALADMSRWARYPVGALLGAAGAGVSVLLLYDPLLRYNLLQGQSALLSFLTTRTGINLNAVWPSLIVPSPASYRQAGLILAALAIGYALLFARRSNAEVGSP